MYNNSGRKIKLMADTMAVIQIVVSLLLAIGIFVLLYRQSGGVAFFIALIVFAIGAVIAWVSNLLLGGFGDLIEETNRIRTVAEAYAKKNKVAIPERKNEDEGTPAIFREPSPDSKLLNKEYCPFCGEALKNGHCDKCDADF